MTFTCYYKEEPFVMTVANAYNIQEPVNYFHLPNWGLHVYLETALLWLLIIWEHKMGVKVSHTFR